MKLYILMTSLALAAGTALGYYNGKGAAQTSFAQDCAASSIAVIYDYSAEETRHFHCFELDDKPEAQPASNSVPEGAIVI